MKVHELRDALDGLDPDATVEISIWTGDDAVWLNVEAERVSSHLVFTYEHEPRSVVQVWTPATSPQYGRGT